MADRGRRVANGNRHRVLRQMIDASLCTGYMAGPVSPIRAEPWAMLRSADQVVASERIMVSWLASEPDGPSREHLEDRLSMIRTFTTEAYP